MSLLALAGPGPIPPRPGLFDHDLQGKTAPLAYRFDMRRNTNSNSYIAAWRERLRREASELHRALAEARAKAKECAALLAGQFGASEVYLIGSVAGAGRFHERSDIDLGVRGLDSHRYLQALSEAAEIAGRDVDLILLDEAPPELVRRTKREGVLLHGRPEVPASKG